MKSLLPLLPLAFLAACAVQPTPEQVFKNADADGDGLLTRSEATNVLIANVFKSMDTDGDGVVSEAEYIAAGGTAADFKKFDTSGTGELSLAEAQANPAAVEHMAQPFDEADVNNNGAITLEEFLAYKKKYEAAVR